MPLIRAKISPNAAMLFPRPQILELAGQPYQALQLRVRTIARIESEVEDLISHPYEPVRESLEALRLGDAISKQERSKHAFKVMSRSHDWPPTWGGFDFNRIMGDEVGCRIFLSIMLRRSNGPVSDDEVLDLAEAMTPACWERLERIAWGFPSWMAFGRGEETPAASRPGRGINWSKTTETLSRERGFRYADISQMFVNQVVNALNGGEPWIVSIHDLPPNGAE